MTNDPRPKNCRFRLEDEDQLYPRSSCEACGRTTSSGLGKECQEVLGKAQNVHPDRPIKAPHQKEETKTDITYDNGLDQRPIKCRFRLSDEGKPYPRSSCEACGKSTPGLLGKSCSEV